MTMGPMCPVVQAGQDCPDAPYAARITVVRATGKIAARAAAADDGTYRIALQAGDYLLQAEASGGGPFPGSAGFPFSVMEGAWTRLDVTLDSGIR
ncbi:MAG: carboxypeptidase regulatory-like domain-containing protein [Chloroflexi bacterium]|nr:carboxypeptidase regulatory-like domain-containing protein [Chloroflexota bacterium]